MSVAIRQQVGLDGTGGTISPSWGMATSTGSTLLAVTNSLNAPTSVPSGWSLLKSQASQYGGSTYNVYAIANAASQSGSHNWVFPASSYPGVILVELTGMPATATLDVVGAANGTSPVSGNDLAINALGPTNNADIAFLALTSGNAGAVTAISATGWSFVTTSNVHGASPLSLSWQNNVGAGTTLPSETFSWTASPADSTYADAFQFTLVAGGAVAFAPTAVASSAATCALTIPAASGVVQQGDSGATPIQVGTYCTPLPANVQAGNTVALAVWVPSTGGSGTVLFDGSTVAAWPVNQSASPTRTVDVPDPLGGPGTCIQFTALNADVFPLTPTANPRAQLVGPQLYTPGDTYFASYELLLPSSTPLASGTSWVTFDTPCYGSPFADSPPLGIACNYVSGDPSIGPDGMYFNWEANSFYSTPYEYIWTMPVAEAIGVWTRFTWQFTVTSNTSYQTTLYVNGNPVASAPMPALDASDNTGPWTPRTSVYYNSGEFASLTAYFKGYKIATTQAAAEGAANAGAGSGVQGIQANFASGWQLGDTVAVGGGALSMYYAMGATGGGNQVAVATTNGAPYYCQATEIGGVGGVIDGVASTGSGSTLTWPQPPGTSGNLLLTSAVGLASGGLQASPGAPWTNYNAGGWTAANGLDTSYQTAQSEATPALSWTQQGSASWGAIGVVFYPVGAPRATSTIPLGTGSTQTVTLNLANVPGNLLTLQAINFLNTVQVKSIAGGGTWTVAQDANGNKAVASETTGGQGTLELWQAPQGTSVATVQVTFTGPTTAGGAIQVAEWPITGSSPLAQVVTTVGTGQTGSTGTITPTTVPEVAIAMVGTQRSGATIEGANIAGGGFTALGAFGATAGYADASYLYTNAIRDIAAPIGQQTQTPPPGFATIIATFRFGAGLGTLIAAAVSSAANRVTTGGPQLLAPTAAATSSAFTIVAIPGAAFLRPLAAGVSTAALALTIVTPATPTFQSVPRSANTRPFTYLMYDLRSGAFLGTLPLQGPVQFGGLIDGSGTFTGQIDIADPNVQALGPLAATQPARTALFVDYQGALIWGGIIWPRNYTFDNQTRKLGINASEIWSYFAQRVQATDYSAPPFSGIVVNPNTMPYWPQEPFDATMIAAQVIYDAIGVPYGNPLGGLGLLVNSAIPNGAAPPSSSSAWIAPTYPYTSLQTVDTIVSQLSQAGYGVGFDYHVDFAYSGAAYSVPVTTVNLSWPRRGRTVAQNQLVVNCATAFNYQIPEDGTQAANVIYETGGSGAIAVTENITPIEQGYPILERVISRANLTSANILELLDAIGLTDSYLNSYPVVVPQITIDLFNPNPGLGQFILGDDIRVLIPRLAGDGQLFDPRFPNGLDQEWRIVQWQATYNDQGTSTLQLTLNQPPAANAIAPAV